MNFNVDAQEQFEKSDDMMESLLCNEVWLSSPNSFDPNHAPPMQQNHAYSLYNTKEDCEQAFALSLKKESSYLPEAGYITRLRSCNLIVPRLRVMQWLIKSRSRLKLSFETVFCAANYLDRFISTIQCHGWKFWMMELLSVASISVASKFNETDAPTLQEIQMEDLDHSFQSSTIQRMELILLRGLKWLLGSTTAYSYFELLTWYIESLNPHSREEVAARVTELLLGTLLDYQFLEFKPCTIAVSALKCSLKELFPLTADAHLAYISKLIPLDHNGYDLVKCHKIMKRRLADRPFHNLVACGESNYCPSSPVTVLLRDRIDISDCDVDLSLLEIPISKANNLKPIKTKRKREEH